MELKRVIDFKLPTILLSAARCTTDRELIVGCMDGVYRVDLEEKSFTKIGSHGSYVSSTAFSNSRGVGISAGYDGVLQWFDWSSKETQQQAKLHEFWSWDMALSPDEKWIASVTGQYLAGGYKYEPAAETEPCVRLVNCETREVIHNLSHTPSVQAVAFSNDSRFVAAGNLMGEVRVWDCHSGEQVGGFTTTELTSWGIIKSHCYLGGVFALRFTPDDQQIVVVGIGDMRDPMAGNGRQTWQRWNWKTDSASKVAEIKPEEAGEGLIEAITFHPNGETVAIGGRLRGGEWNVALFDAASGARTGTLKSGYRVTDLLFSADGNQLIVVGGQGQPGKDSEGKIPHFGRVEVYDLS